MCANSSTTSSIREYLGLYSIWLTSMVVAKFWWDSLFYQLNNDQYCWWLFMVDICVFLAIFSLPFVLLEYKCIPQGFLDFYSLSVTTKMVFSGFTNCWLRFYLVLHISIMNINSQGLNWLGRWVFQIHFHPTVSYYFNSSFPCWPITS